MNFKNLKKIIYNKLHKDLEKIEQNTKIENSIILSHPRSGVNITRWVFYFLKHGNLDCSSLNGNKLANIWNDIDIHHTHDAINCQNGCPLTVSKHGNMVLILRDFNELSKRPKLVNIHNLVKNELKHQFNYRHDWYTKLIETYHACPCKYKKKVIYFEDLIDDLSVIVDTAKILNLDINIDTSTIHFENLKTTIYSMYTKLNNNRVPKGIDVNLTQEEKEQNTNQILEFLEPECHKYISRYIHD